MADAVSNTQPAHGTGEVQSWFDYAHSPGAANTVATVTVAAPDAKLRNVLKHIRASLSAAGASNLVITIGSYVETIPLVVAGVTDLQVHIRAPTETAIVLAVTAAAQVTGFVACDGYVSRV